MRAHRPPKITGSTIGEWCCRQGPVRSRRVGGAFGHSFLPGRTSRGHRHPGANKPLHLHPIFQETDVYGDGKPTRIAHTSRDVRELDKDLPVTDEIDRGFTTSRGLSATIPVVEEYANAYRKAAENYKELLKDDPGNPSSVGGWNFYQQTG